MPQPVVVDFLVRNMPAVTNAFRTVEQAAAASERAQTTARARGAQQRTNTSEREARDKIRAMLKTDAEIKRIIERETKATATAAKQRVVAEERAEREMTRAADRAANERMRISRRVDREYAAMQKRRSAEDARIIREDDRRNEQSAKNRQRIRERSATMAGRYAAQEANRESHAAQQGRTGFARAAYGGLATGVNRIGRGVAATAGLLGQLGGGFSIADSVMGESKLRKQAAVLSANTVLSGAGTKGADASLGGAMSTNDILSKAKAIGLQQNIDPSDILKGFDEIKKLTGNVEKATQVMPGIAKLATATGGDVHQMSGLAANILAANPNIDNEDLQKQMRIFTKQGVVGGVEVPDMARYGSRITAGASMYGGDKEKNEATLGAMAQMSRQYGSAGSAAEATLGALRFSTDVAKHSSTLKKGGIDVSDGQGNLKDAQSILLEMVEKTKGDVTKMAGLGLGDRGVKPLEGVANIYKNAGGGDKGMAAIRAEFSKYTTGVSKDEIDAASKRVLAEQQVEIEMKKLQIAVGEQLLPELAKLVPVLRDALPTITRVLESFTKLANWAASNPFSAVGAVLAVSLGEAVAKAGIAKAIETSLATSLGQKGGLTVATASLAITSAMIAIETIADKQSHQVSRDSSQAATGALVASQVRAGDPTTTAGQLQDLIARRNAVKERVETQRSDVNSKEAIEYVGMLGKAARYTPVGYAATKAFGGGKTESDLDEAGALYQKSREDRLKNSEEALMKLNKAIDIASANLAKLGTNGPGGGPDGKPPAASTGIVQRAK